MQTYCSHHQENASDVMKRGISYTFNRHSLLLSKSSANLIIFLGMSGAYSFKSEMRRESAGGKEK